MEKNINNFFKIKEIYEKNNLYSIYKAFKKNTQDCVSITVLEKKNIFNDNERENLILDKKFKNTIYDLKNINSDYFIKLIDFIDSNDYYYLVTELLNDNIEDYLSKSNKTIKLEQIKKIFMILNNGFNELINYRRINIDIKLKNIYLLFNRNNNISENIIKINLYCLNNILNNCGISLIKNNETNNYIIQKNKRTTSAFTGFIKSIKNIFNSLLSLSDANNKLKNEIDNIISICDKNILNDTISIIGINEYFNNSFW
jgi:hypothetical protein